MQIRDVAQKCMYFQDLARVKWRGPHYTAEAIKRHISNKDARILDVCGGTGAVAELVSSHGHYIVLPSLMHEAPMSKWKFFSLL